MSFGVWRKVIVLRIVPKCWSPLFAVQCHPQRYLSTTVSFTGKRFSLLSIVECSLRTLVPSNDVFLVTNGCNEGASSHQRQHWYILASKLHTLRDLFAWVRTKRIPVSRVYQDSSFPLSFRTFSNPVPKYFESLKVQSQPF
jgi:hypothetical protein